MDLIGIIVDGKMPFFGPYDAEKIQGFFPGYQHAPVEVQSKPKVARKNSKSGMKTTELSPTKKEERTNLQVYMDYIR